MLALAFQNCPKTCRILPKWQNFAKSGHTGQGSKGIKGVGVIIDFVNRKTLSLSFRESPSPLSLEVHTSKHDIQFHSKPKSKKTTPTRFGLIFGGREFGNFGVPTVRGK